MLVNFLNYIKSHLLPKKLIIRNILIVFGVVFILLLLDQLTKNLIFTNQEYEQGYYSLNIQINWSIIGFRPLLHHGVTSGIQNIFGFWLIHFFSVLLILFVIGAIFFVYDVGIFIGFSVLLAGNLGNMVDRIAYNNHVKDLLFLPFHDNGTFNFADIFIVSGAAIVPLSLGYRYFWTKFQKNRKIKKNQLKFDQDPEQNKEQ